MDASVGLHTVQDSRTEQQEEVEDFTEQLKPPVSLADAQAAAKTLARFMQEDPSVFSAEKQFTFQRQINSELQKLLMARLNSQKQRRITNFFKS